ncbi:Cell division control protein 4 [Escovopsis weberi]|uniref:Cell division control protein 4 n=1 Tax=Escovopsis weberi TaxID=150374 RepID=A0A0M8N8D5_ESCWE|nr:Cell division control protein 4 [Escovopsis weberi]
MNYPPSPAWQQVPEPRRPSSAQKQQKVSVDISESGPQISNGARRFQLQVSECVETKTITTTTRLTRQFPQVFLRNTTALDDLDTKEYPLAKKSPPPEISRFSYMLSAAHEGLEHSGDEGDGSDPETSERPSSPKEATFIKQEKESADSTPPHRYSRVSSRSPAEAAHGKFRSRPFLADSPSMPRSRQRASTHTALSDGVRRTAMQANGAGGSQHDTGERPSRVVSSGFPATPDTTELADAAQRSSQRRAAAHFDRAQHSPAAPAASGRSKSPPYDAASPAGSDAHTIFSGTAATPPVDDDAEPESFADVDDALQESVRAVHNRPTIDVVAAQDASLPSPRLSPTLAAAQLVPADGDQAAQSSLQSSTAAQQSSLWAAGSGSEEPADEVMTDSVVTAVPPPYSPTDSTKPMVVDTQSMLEVFESMKTEMKTYMIFQFLRRCPRPTLRVVANTVNPALKCDFLHRLPLELSYHILYYLDHRDLSRCAQVSRHWRNIVDRNETGWKELFDRDGYKLPPGELQKAITQGWGWQDPVGIAGYERDLSMLGRLTSSEQVLLDSINHDLSAKTRSSKRKRRNDTYPPSERSKRRVGAQEVAACRDEKLQCELRQHKSAGPLSAANAAITAVPDPQLGLPGLRQLHLYKSLYRRHHMIRQSWTSGEVKPSHVAFAAHPRHVITCLQFDDDKIITGSDDTLIHIYDTKTGNLRKKLEGHEGGVWALQYEGNILVSGSTDRSVRVWDIERGVCQQVFYGHTSTVRCLQILMPTETGRNLDGSPVMQPEKPLIITGSRDSQLRVWRLPEVGSRRYTPTAPPAQESDCPYFIRALTGHTHSVRAISAYGDILVSGSYDSTVRVWRISTGDTLHVLSGHAQKVYSVVLDPARNRCISGSMDSMVKIWDLATGSCLFTLEGHSLLVGLLDLRDDKLVSAAADSTLRIWDPETGKCRNTLMAHTGAITCFQHDGRKVISGSEKTVKMWDVRTGQCIQDLLTDLSGVWQVKSSTLALFETGIRLRNSENAFS